MSAIRPSLNLVQHLGLYATFHQSRANRLLHVLSLPIICFTAFVLLSWLPLPRVSSVSTMVVVPLSAVFVIALIDRAGALWLCAWLLPLFLLASLLTLGLDFWPTIPLALLGHLAAWGLPVGVGHLRLEPRLIIKGDQQDTNLYFREGYFLAHRLGCRASAADTLIQFAIGLLGCTHELLSAFGLRRPLSQAVECESLRIRERVARGLPPFAS